MDLSTTDVNAVVVAVASGLAGVLLTLLGGIVGAVFQARNEHRKWVRERRYEAIVSARVFVGRLEAQMDVQRELNTARAGSRDAARITEIDGHLAEARSRALLLREHLPESTAALEVVGPPAVRRALDPLVQVFLDPDALGRAAVVEEFARVSRRALGISQSRWQRFRFFLTDLRAARRR